MPRLQGGTTTVSQDYNTMKYCSQDGTGSGRGEGGAGGRAWERGVNDR